MAETTIEWCDYTFNGWEGCQKVGLGCDNCYAEARNIRFTGGTNWGPGAPRRRTSAANWRKPIQWNRMAEGAVRRPRVFCSSLADVFDNAVDPQWRADLFELIRATPNLDWLLLTKRPGNIAKMLPSDWGKGWVHVWIGCTIVNQEEADRDIPKLLAVPAAVRFLSMEPLLGPVDIDEWLHDSDCADTRKLYRQHGDRPLCHCGERPVNEERIDWVIVGGESGPRARPMHPDWARQIRDQCEAAGVPFHFKQWGENLPSGQVGNACNGKTHEAFQILCDDELLTEASNSPPHNWPDGNKSFRLNKRYSGRLLDGVTHDGFPKGGVEA